jgi:hypothetical protein
MGRLQVTEEELESIGDTATPEKVDMYLEKDI